MHLRHVPRDVFQQVITMDGDIFATTALFADLCRLNCLYAIMRAGSGHIGSSFSSLDLVSWIYRGELGPEHSSGVYFSSKGHDAPGLYAVLAGLGILDYDAIHSLRRCGGLPGHPDVHTPGIAANTGSLGMGISKAKGMAEAHRLTGRRQRIFVMTGDGELQEGQIWESLQGAANRGLGELTVIVDHNRIQSDTWVVDVADLGRIEEKFAAFGWNVERCDGHDLPSTASAIQRLVERDDTPGVLVADTIKGRGISFMEGIQGEDSLYHFHSGAPSIAVFDAAVDELLDRCNERIVTLGGKPLELINVEIPDRTPVRGQKLVSAYTAALISVASTDDRVIALDGDLMLDTGLIPFRERFPDRFIECGIAEQDMVSQAGGLALGGLLPIVHSFACFLSSRPNEQIYTNATERTKIIYVGSLAGLIPGGPGHSHQAVRDISSIAAVPDLTAVEPGYEGEVEPLLRFCLDELPGSVYFRLVTPPIELPFPEPSEVSVAFGQGTTLRSGNDGVLFAAGPLLLSQAWLAAERLAAERGVDLRVVNLPWLNRVDSEWLADQVDDVQFVVVLDNHYRAGGQGHTILAEIACFGVARHCLHLAVDAVPVCGRNDEVLAWHGLDADTLVDRIGELAAVCP